MNRAEKTKKSLQTSDIIIITVALLVWVGLALAGTRCTGGGWLSHVEELAMGKSKDKKLCACGNPLKDEWDVVNGNCILCRILRTRMMPRKRSTGLGG